VKISLCITTYNNSKDLSKVLSGCYRLTKLPDEIIICDDGSKPSVVAKIEKLIEESPIPIKHIWQEDLGWRLSRIRNLGIKEAVGDFIVFIDGDCIPHPDLIFDYHKHAIQGEFILGNRIRIRREYRDKFKRYSIFSILQMSVQSRIINRRFALKIPFEKGKIYYPRDNSSMNLHHIGLGCNHGFWKKDAVAIGGYEELFKSYGAEDSDFAYRLINSGVRGRRFFGSCLVYHLDHEIKSVSLIDNEHLFLASVQGHRIKSEQSSILSMEIDDANNL
jgi:glycosyltransferase involved in cell wall biosynthesis